MNFKNMLDDLRNDPYFLAENSLLDFTEKVCELHGQFKGIYKIYYHIFEWVADKMLWRKLR